MFDVGRRSAVIVDDDDNEKSVSWFRRSLKIGGVAGGIAGFVIGCVLVGLELYGGWEDGGFGAYSVRDFIEMAEILGGTLLAGVIVGDLLGVVVGRFMKGRRGFVPAVMVVGAVGGVIGAVFLIGMIISRNLSHRKYF